MFNILDTAFVHFPTDSAVLNGTKNLLYRGLVGMANNQQANIVNQYLSSAGVLFGKGDYAQYLTPQSPHSFVELIVTCFDRKGKSEKEERGLR